MGTDTFFVVVLKMTKIVRNLRLLVALLECHFVDAVQALWEPLFAGVCGQTFVGRVLGYNIQDIVCQFLKVCCDVDPTSPRREENAQ